MFACFLSLLLSSLVFKALKIDFSLALALCLCLPPSAVPCSKYFLRGVDEYPLAVYCLNWQRSSALARLGLLDATVTLLLRVWCPARTVHADRPCTH